jgi:hypothetical protein
MVEIAVKKTGAVPNERAFIKAKLEKFSGKNAYDRDPM